MNDVRQMSFHVPRLPTGRGAYSPGFYGEIHTQAISRTCGRVGKTVACRPRGTGFESRFFHQFFFYPPKFRYKRCSLVSLSG